MDERFYQCENEENEGLGTLGKLFIAGTIASLAVASMIAVLSVVLGVYDLDCTTTRIMIPLVFFLDLIPVILLGTGLAIHNHKRKKDPNYLPPGRWHEAFNDKDAIAIPGACMVITAFGLFFWFLRFLCWCMK